MLVPIALLLLGVMPSDLARQSVFFGNGWVFALEDPAVSSSDSCSFPADVKVYSCTPQPFARNTRVVPANGATRLPCRMLEYGCVDFFSSPKMGIG